MFEPIGGTAPNFTGLNQINPMAAIGAAHIMLDHLGESEAAVALENAKKEVILKMESMQAAKMGFGTDQIGDMVVDQLYICFAGCEFYLSRIIFLNRMELVMLHFYTGERNTL